MARKAYPSDVTDAEWQIIEQLLPSAQATGRPRQVDLREDHQWNILRSAGGVFLAGATP